MKRASFLRDEQGKLSMARTLLCVHLAYAYVALTAKLLGLIVLEPPDYALLTAYFVALSAWAAGPRGLQYLGPRIRGAFGTFTSMARKWTLPQRPEEK